MTAIQNLVAHVSQVEKGLALGDVNTLTLRDPRTFHVGELHNHVQSWTAMASRNPFPNHVEVLTWIELRVSVFPYFQHFKGTYQQMSYDSDRPAFRRKFSLGGYGMSIGLRNEYWVKE